MTPVRPTIFAVFVTLGCSPEMETTPDVPEPEVTRIQQALIGPSDVGVIAPAGMNCPNEHVMVTMENERDGNWNEKEGWLGATEQDHSYTRLHLCRVDGR